MAIALSALLCLIERLETEELRSFILVSSVRVQGSCGLVGLWLLVLGLEEMLNILVNLENTLLCRLRFLSVRGAYLSTVVGVLVLLWHPWLGF